MENKKEKMTSIARKINWRFWRSKLASTIWFDIFLALLFMVFIFISTIKQLPNGFHDLDSMAIAFNQDRQLCLEIISKDGLRIMEAIKPWLVTAFPYAIAIAGYQFFSLFFSMFRTGQIREKLRPLNDLAERAEAIGSIPLDATHLENLERAISSVTGTEDEVRIETQDKDLQNIEAALNSLLYRMKESHKQQTRFVSDASHELRTPIAVIQGYVNMLDRWGKEDESVLNESIEALKHESDYMKELVEQLLFLARGDSGRNTLNMVDFNLAEVVEEVFEESMMIDAKHEYRLKVCGVDCTQEDITDDCVVGDDMVARAVSDEIYVVGPDGAEVAVTDRGTAGGESGADAEASATAGGQHKNPRHRVVPMHGDVAMIKQSIRIFVQNAAKYTAEGDSVTLGVDFNDGHASYMIQDEGIGIEGKDVSHIFERFYRSDEARNGKTGGSGLGLSIAKWIIDAHEGKVEVISRPDFGSRFTVYF